MTKVEVMRFNLRGGDEVFIVNLGLCYVKAGSMESSWALPKYLADKIIAMIHEGKSRIRVSEHGFYFEYNSSGNLTVGWKMTDVRGKVNSMEHKVMFDGSSAEVII